MYFRLSLKKDNIERKQIYFRGHTDGYAYLKKIGGGLAVMKQTLPVFNIEIWKESGGYAILENS